MADSHKPDALRIIVTRPEGQQQSLMAAIAADFPDAELFHQPLIEIVTIEDDNNAVLLRQRMLNIDHYQAVIAISKNAAQTGLQWLDKYWPQPPEEIRWYAVGPTTADELSGELHPVYMPEQRFDSEGVLELASLQQVQDEKILIWRGEGGRETLANVLRQRGAQVDYAELYERRQIEYSTKQWQAVLQPPSLLLLSSGQGLDIIEQQVDNLADQVSAILVPSERVAEKARKKGYQQVLVAASARDQDVLTQLRDWVGLQQ
ncbi:uroporphyrinogen-III synthase [Bacterioplanoides sp. SCSIO 12839]|uniref:uroporphyrinogen-III synthase n=1 Tax=Bacterioplanoides sp. SCSIO 12839 TaxID=2829569 RepID=UPI002107A6BC|nr:uroporphyrinogen-III synthase [Bacterioplanoides sp. SCSIO 12839]UTW48242.1 uroporphyrinogen-III synthase [Bacterioplanoides sp. SCSIO 12839]